MESFQLRENEGNPSLFFLQGQWERDGLTAGFTSRQAGNVALHVGDDAAAVIANRERVAETIGWPFEAFTCAEQVHGVDVRTVTREEVGSGRTSRENAFPHCDALVTNESNALLAMFFADCVPLYFYDPFTGSLGLAHAGWKGTAADIAQITIDRLQSEFGARPENMLAAIGPSIGSCCYEVDEYVLDRVRPLLPADDLTIVEPSGRDGHARLDLKHLNRHLMIKAGIMPSRIEMSSWCTGCRTDLLFSHRVEKGAAGRMMSWLGRKTR